MIYKTWKEAYYEMQDILDVIYNKYNLNIEGYLQIIPYLEKYSIYVCTNINDISQFVEVSKWLEDHINNLKYDIIELIKIDLQYKNK